MDAHGSKLTLNIENNKEDVASKEKKKQLQMKLLLPDRELQVWEKWIQIRKEETTKLSEKLGRNPVDLTMNLSQKVRQDLERKTALSNAQIHKKPHVRGTLFEPPLRLKQRCYCQPAYEIHRTRSELGQPRVVEHIGIPKKIQETELGMAGDTQRIDCHLLNADYIMYRQKREEELEENLCKIDPFNPSTSNLMIQGYKPMLPSPKQPTPPTIIMSAPTDSSKEAYNGIYAVKINNTVLYKPMSGYNLSHISTLQHKTWHETCNSWTYYFNVPIKKACRGKLFLQNLGTMTLIYYWKMIKKSLPSIPANIFEQNVFFFNKNEDVLSPGQSRNVCFTFVSNKPGIFNEHWELAFANVFFFDTHNEKLKINLYADAVEDVNSIKQNVEDLKACIHRQSIFNLINDILNQVLEKIFEVVPQTYPYKHYFIEKQLFIMKNPVCFYHQTEVASMKDLYSKTMSPGNTWDLSISSWRKTMMSNEYDDRMKYFDALKKSHRECLKPWYEGSELLKEKYRAVNELLGQLADQLDKEYTRLTDFYAEKSPTRNVPNNGDVFSITKVHHTQQNISNVFYLRAYDYVATTIELCAGILSSLDSNRWIEFDFCRQ